MKSSSLFFKEFGLNKINNQPYKHISEQNIVTIMAIARQAPEDTYIILIELLVLNTMTVDETQQMLHYNKF